VSLDVLNKFVLGAIGLFGLCLYIALVATGIAELISGLPKAGAQKKTNATRKWGNAKKSPHS
jgi:hypothetical protein